MPGKVKIKVNSIDKVEELLNETYTQACEQLNLIQNEMNKLAKNTTFDELTMDEKQKYGKVMHDYMGDKDRAIKTKMDIAKLLTEITAHKGNVEETLNDKNFTKQTTSLNLEQLRKNIASGDAPQIYTMK